MNRGLFFLLFFIADVLASNINCECTLHAAFNKLPTSQKIASLLGIILMNSTLPIVFTVAFFFPHRCAARVNPDSITIGQLPTKINNNWFSLFGVFNKQAGAAAVSTQPQPPPQTPTIQIENEITNHQTEEEEEEDSQSVVSVANKQEEEEEEETSTNQLDSIKIINQ